MRGNMLVSTVGLLGDAARTAWWTTADALRIRPAMTVAMWTSNLLVMAMPSLQVWMIRWVTGPTGLAGSPSDMRIGAVILLLTLGAVVIAVSYEVTSRIRELLVIPLGAEYRTRLTRAMADITPAQTLDRDLNDRIRAARDAIPYNIADHASNATVVVGAVFSMVMLAASLWTTNPIAAVLLGAAIIPELVAQAANARLGSDLWPLQGRYSRRAAYLEQVQDYPPASTELAATRGSFGVPEQAHDSYMAMSGLWRRISLQALRGAGLSALAFAVLAGGAFALIIVHDHAALATVAAAVVGVITALSVTRSTGDAFGELMSSTPMVIAYRRLMDTLTANPTIPETHGPVGVRVEHVTYRYPIADDDDKADTDEVGGTTDDASDATTQSDPSDAAARPALDDVSLSIDPGSIVAFVGENGSGKTTLAKIIAGILEPDAGTVSLPRPGDSTVTTPLARLGATSMTFQDFTRLEVTVREFIDPDGRKTDRQLWDGLSRAHADAIIAGQPNGLDAQLGAQWGGIGLSGGQWQRLALARTFLSDQPLWILDEPTAAVDATAEAAIYHDLTVNRPDGTTVIVISHRPHVLVHMDRIIVISHGRIAETGTYDQLIANHGMFSRLDHDSLE
ncbi:ABC transporter ATP-binding protein/permease [Bifidobacterium amazonense]|uniref:ABC transporter ATP-binding protein/permease n=1 Tax=Bifidobacterium amazonense TaxID=2809027 RepID=A0ABS9VYC7_9BIFI|nr:ABC transporter ATP-binding protein [Bifidobacterium amazonense]MCH9277103.1 ABC transporter ATP-binding protein/permease [Bifidobacterium amazonense]